jgi:hypothetical protein
MLSMLWRFHLAYIYDGTEYSQAVFDGIDRRETEKEI